MHKVPWTVGHTFAQICQAYVTYIKKRYGNCPTIVFDGGYDAASTKDTAHVRRAKGRIGKTVRLHLNNQLSMSKSDFLLSKDNKQNFLLTLGDELTKTGITVNHASGDADLLIVQTALKAAKDYPTVLIGEDTDLLVLALHHFTNEKALYFTYEPKQNQQSAEVWNIGHAKQILGKICHGILVIHAFSGCDTTSHIHSVGKPTVLEKYFFGPVCKQRRYNRCRGTSYAFHNWSYEEREDNGSEASCRLLQEVWREVCCQT